jgi:hypothetical protein
MRVATTRAVLALATAILLGGGLLTACSTDTPAAPPPGQGSIAAQQQSTVAPLADYTMTVSKLGLSNAALVPLGLNADKTIQVPPLSAPQELGVYSKGPLPGGKGPAVILGHINANGVPGAFAHLDTLKAGDQVATTAPGGKATKFVVYKVQTVPKAAFPTAAVYSDTSGPELRLITCGGALDRSAHNYLSNVIVWARQT